ncbi:hypothetical protein [Flavobacterium chungnamense]
MKKLNLLKLNIELFLRWIALLYGYVFSFFALFQIIWIYTANNVYDKLKISIPDYGSLGIIIFIVKIFLPILISIFFLVATRNFKEIKKLIEENKKL